MRTHHIFEELIFMIQIAEDLWVIDLRIIGIFEPSVVVMDCPAMMSEGVLGLPGDRWSRVCHQSGRPKTLFAIMFR